MSQQRRALVVVMSNVRDDPRVRREIDWLAGAGWIVDTLGLGEHPAPEVHTHFIVGRQPSWLRSRIGAALVYTLLPNQSKFTLLVEKTIPREARRLIASGEYDLVVFNDREFIPLVRNRRVFTPAARAAHVHLDLHEYFAPQQSRDSLWRALTSGYQSWVRSIIGDPAFTTRSTVASGIAELYAREFGVPQLSLIRNSPVYVEQEPGVVDPADIRLIHHGVAQWSRGLRTMVEAMRMLDARFSLTLMLAGDPAVVEQLSQESTDLGDRVRIVPPVPMLDIAHKINPYDLEIVFLRPATRSLEFALPNKFFEAVQGRLGLVVGESPMMAELVAAHGLGVVVHGWEAEDLASALSSLTAAEVTEYKAAAHRAAGELNADTERDVFLRTVTHTP